MKKVALNREDRLRQIMQVFAAAIQSAPPGESVELTVADIARLMHLSPSTKLRLMVTELVEDGSLDFRKETIPGIAKYRRLYSPNPEKFERPKPQYKGQGRAMKINSKQGSFLVEVGL